MITGTAKLVVDLGNSETRILTIFGKTKSGSPRRRVTAVSNRYAEHDPTIALNNRINEMNSVIFQSIGEVSGKAVEGMYVGGTLVDREYSARAIRPTALDKKYSSLVTVLSLHRAFLEGYRAVAGMENVAISALELEWEVTVLMPPADITPETSKAMAEVIRSVTKIKFDMPDVEKEIKIGEGKIEISAEGMNAFSGVWLTRDGDVREGYEYMEDSSVLVLDVGAGTSDFLVIDGGSAVESTKFTSENGGNNVASSLRSILRNRGYAVNNVEAREAVVRGEIRDGATVVNVRDAVAQAKSQVASKLVSELQDFFESSGYSARSINYLLVVGGGAIEDHDANPEEKIEPISKYLIEQMKAYSPNIGLVDIPTEEVRKNGEIVHQPLNPRLLNIIGAGIFASMG